MTTFMIGPKTHVRKVNAGRVGSSVVGTTFLTCSIGDSAISTENRNSNANRYVKYLM